MRTFTLGLLAAAVLGSATAAFAQASMPSSMMAPVPQGSGAPVGMTLSDTPQDRYEFGLMMLKKKVDRLTREDGGKLTPEHQASLQKELDTLNGRFGVKVARR